jgi:hypothetical protein
MVAEVCARRVVWVVSAAIAALALAAPGAATTFVRMDAAQLARRSDAALIATVAAVQPAALENGAVVTRVVLAPERVVLGTLPGGPLVLHEPGGAVDGLVEHVFGAPRYRPGERVLVFVQRTAGGTLRTTAMAMGRYELGGGAEGSATRRLDEATVLDPDSGAPLPAGPLVERLADVLAALPGKARRPVALRAVEPAARSVTAAPFTYLGRPSRWFEPDDGQPVRFRTDRGGDAVLGAEASAEAVAEALVAWSSVDGASLLLADDDLPEPVSFAGCGGDSRLVFNDPFDEIDAPVECRGVLGIGGYCYAEEQREVGGQAFNRIRVGKVTIADGWGGCRQWTPCNVAQVVTHEMGHALGLGHSQDEAATMSGTANFDGRCAALAADDEAGIRALYPAPDTPTPSPTTTPPPTATASATATLTPTDRPPTPTAPPIGARGVRGRITYQRSGLAVPGVRVRLRGPGGRIAVTQGAGDYRFDELDAGDWSVEPYKDDSSGAGISALDAALALQASAGTRELDEAQRAACDVTGNGSVNPLDAARILEFAVGTRSDLPAAETCGSDFVFFPLAAPAAHQQVIAPARDLDGCRGGALRYTPLLGQVSGQNFRAVRLGDCTGDWTPGDPRGAEPVLAPPGTALELRPLRRLPGGRWRLAIGVHSPQPANALEVELRYDAGRLTPLSARTAHLGTAALVDTESAQPGRLHLALASAIALPGDGRAVVVVDFAASATVSSRAVRAYGVRVDDRLVDELR